MRSCRRAGRGAVWFGVFFFQAEDGIRDLTVTGVQTCALPIYTAGGRAGAGRAGAGGAAAPADRQRRRRGAAEHGLSAVGATGGGPASDTSCFMRSEERRVGEEGRSRWSPYH